MGVWESGSKVKNHLIEGGCLTDQLCGYICYILIFCFFFLGMEKWGEVGVINGRGLGDGSKRRREWDRQVSGREKERAKKEKTHPEKGVP